MDDASVQAPFSGADADLLAVGPVAEQATPRFIVVQMGARHNYAVPAAFARLGILEALYTDLCGARGLGRAVAGLARYPVPLRARLAALGARLPPPEVACKTTTFDWVGLQLNMLFWTGQAASHSLAGRRYRSLSQAIGTSMVRAGYGNATHVYSLFGEGGPFLTEAKHRGLRVVSEVYIALSTDTIIHAEARTFPEWSVALPPFTPSVRAPNEVMLTASDTFVCPSEFVRDDLVAAAGVPRERTVVVPYTVGKQWLAVHNRPEPGRILFAGTADLRKGIHYFAMAADRLRAGHRYRFRVAGHAVREVTSQPVCRALEFLGRLPRALIHEEFAVADLLVLPTLAEGSAGVIYEALGAGLPVVTTKAAGSVARDGIDGLIVPERDPDALAAAIESIVEDRSRRARMAAAARERAREFTVDKFASRLITSLQSCAS
jgi:glycosyltransferase involved in cell wall biosynthesis